MIRNIDDIRERYMRDSLPVRLGGLAANLARINSFSKNPANKEAVESLLEESKHFIEWSAKDTTSEIAFDLVQIQVNLSKIQLNLDKVWFDDLQRAEIGVQAKEWSNKVLQMSGLLG
jgi:hypothetical protein